MPGRVRKRWNFELVLGGIKGIQIIRGGNPVADSKGRPMGSITNLSIPHTSKSLDQAKTFPDQAIQVDFKSGTIVLNRHHFEWNTSYFFNKLFKLPEIATNRDFVACWETNTEYNEDRGFAVPCDPDGQRSISQEDMSDDESSSQIPSQTIQGESSSSFVTLSSTQLAMEQPSSSKKLKHSDPLDDSTFSKRYGTCELLVSNLIPPDKINRCIRPVDTTFLQALIKKFESDPSAPGVPPIAVLCTTVSDLDHFDFRRKDAYRYEVLGGQHTALARQDVSSRYPGNSMVKKVLAEVYVGLTNDEALRLASWHNINGHFVHKMTHRDYVEACRSKLFVLGSQDVSGETPKSTPEWKDICKRCILPKEVGRTTSDNIFSQASFSRRIWLLASEVMNKFEDGDLKNQVLTAKSLVAKPEFQQQYLSPIQCLPDDFKADTLQQVIDGVLSLSELKQKATEHRAQRATEKAFCKLTNTTWEEAKRRFLHHTCPDRLQRFTSVIHSKKMPDMFVAFCQSALKNESLQEIGTNLFSVNGSAAYLVEGNVLDISCSAIRKTHPTYMGGNLFIGYVQKSWTQDDIEKLVYSSRQVNTIPEKNLMYYNVVLFGQLEKQEQMKAALLKCYDITSVCFWHYNSPDQGQTLGFVPTVGSMVVGHFSVSGSLLKEHFNFNSPTSNIFSPEKNEQVGDGRIPTSILKATIRALSFELGTHYS